MNKRGQAGKAPADGERISVKSARPADNDDKWGGNQYFP